MKKAIYIFLAVALMLSVSINAFSATKYVIGDANRDGSVSITDATTIQLYLVGDYKADADFINRADVDADKDISVIDATYIQRLIAQIIDKLPGEEKEPTYDDDGYYDQIVKP